MHDTFKLKSLIADSNQGMVWVKIHLKAMKVYFSMWKLQFVIKIFDRLLFIDADCVGIFTQVYRPTAGEFGWSNCQVIYSEFINS